MADLRDSWQRIEAHLRRAHELSGAAAPADIIDYLDHNELELAADALADLGDRSGDLPRPFWQALQYAYENMKLDDTAVLCRFRIYESEHGFVEARLTLIPTADGGKARSIFTDYRPNWSLGNRAASGELELNGAPITIEDAASLAPGGTAIVRLHPLHPPSWMKLQPGADIAMHEGSRVVGRAVVLRVTLRNDG